MSLSARRELLASTAPRYQASGRKQKGIILKEFVASTDYDIKYAIVLLNRVATKTRLEPSGRHRTAKYGADVVPALVELWKLSGSQCGKLLSFAIPHLIDRLAAFDELHLSPSVDAKLRSISPASIDRLLKKVRRGGMRGISTTCPGSLLKHQISIRTFSDWNEAEPGFAEIDLVAHCADDGGGDFAYTLTLTDISTSWVENTSIKNRSQIAVTDALERIINRMPFALKGIDCDNGSEFINHHLAGFCKEREITFTRSRPYRKNDQCYVEQKNGHVVRRLIGYARYESAEAVDLLNRIYSNHRLLVNFFQPCRKLTSKVRTGAKVKKDYDVAQTPYARLIASNTLSNQESTEITNYYLTINPGQVWRRIDELMHQLRKHATRTDNDGSSPATPLSHLSTAAVEGRILHDAAA